MKSSKIAFITLALIAAATAQAHDVVASVAGSNALTSVSASSAIASGNGAATANSFNQGQAQTFGSVAGSVSADNAVANTTSNHSLFGTNNTRTTVDSHGGDVNITGYTITRNISGASTTSSGSALGAAGAVGTATANVGGTGSFYTVANGPQGNVAGQSAASTTTAAAAIGTGSAVQNAGMTSEFAAGASADITSTTVQTGKNYGVFSSTFVPSNTTSAGDVKNTSTSTLANAGSNGGFTNQYGSIGSSVTGSAAGAIINNASAGSLANASVAGQVSTSLRGGL